MSFSESRLQSECLLSPLQRASAIQRQVALESKLLRIPVDEPLEYFVNAKSQLLVLSDQFSKENKIDHQMIIVLKLVALLKQLGLLSSGFQLVKKEKLLAQLLYLGDHVVDWRHPRDGIADRSLWDKSIHPDEKENRAAPNISKVIAIFLAYKVLKTLTIDVQLTLFYSAAKTMKKGSFEETKRRFKVLKKMDLTHEERDIVQAISDFNDFSGLDRLNPASRIAFIRKISSLIDNETQKTKDETEPQYVGQLLIKLRSAIVENIARHLQNPHPHVVSS